MTMTKVEIYEAVNGNATLVAMLPDTQAIASALSVGRVDTRETLIGEGTFMNVVGAQTGADLLDAMDELAKTNNVLRRGMKLLYSGNLDVALPSTRGMLDALLPVEAATALKALAEYTVPVSEFDVRCALLNNDGTWRV
jgi:hypothetical protein